MEMRVQKISVMSLAKVLCTLHAVVGLILGVIISVGATMNLQEGGLWSMGLAALVLLPLINASLGFFAGLFLGGCYNAYANMFGGVSLELVEN